MGKKVFANGMEIAHKAGVGKVMAAFPDVCLSPPPPPTGPLPVPYPNTSFAKDLQEGSTSVKIGGKPLALNGQSYYKSSPLGNEAATRNFGGSVITHTIAGRLTSRPTRWMWWSRERTFAGTLILRPAITPAIRAARPRFRMPKCRLLLPELSKKISAPVVTVHGMAKAGTCIGMNGMRTISNGIMRTK